MAKIIDGKAIAEGMRKRIKEEVENLPFRPGLAVILVGNNPSSKVYISRKEIACEEIGFYSEKHKLPEDASEERLISLIKRLNSNKLIHGILVQLPLPEQIDEKKIINAIDHEKDVDGFHPSNSVENVANKDKLIACTPKGIIHLIKSVIPIEGRHAVVVGRSKIVGAPTAQLLLNENATVTICHSKTGDISKHTKDADILVAAAGKPKLITSDIIKEGAVVIDVGTTLIEGKFVGDVDFENVRKKAYAITPVPGGVGPMTVAMLMENTLQAAKNQRKKLASDSLK